LVASADGKTIINVSGKGNDALQLGVELAGQAIARGADEILKLAAIH